MFGCLIPPPLDVIGSEIAMRSNTKCKDKFYTSNWCINGQKLNLLENPRRCYTNKQISITVAPDLQEKVSCDEQEVTASEKKSKRLILQLNQKDYECSDKVLNKQLKYIYETVEVEDFERILNNFYISPAYRQLPGRSNSDVLRTIDAENIYEQFFGRYYTFLEDTSNDTLTPEV